jgi:hypothetical protein
MRIDDTRYWGPSRQFPKNQFTAIARLAFSATGVTIIRGDSSNASLTHSEYYFAVILEIFTRQHSVESAYQSYCDFLKLLPAMEPASLNPDGRAHEWLSRCTQMLLIQDKVLVCPSESMQIAYQIALASFSEPASRLSAERERIEEFMSVINIVDLTHK